MNPDLSRLQPYPFERLNRLKQGIQPPADLTSITLSIGEPQHSAPDFITAELVARLDTLARYPLTRGEAPLRAAIAQWLCRRFHLPTTTIDSGRQILPVNGTREALFAFAQAVVDRRSDPLVVMPNPFYQIYEGAALLAGAEPYFLNTTAENGFVPDYDAVPAEVWQRCQLLYLCSPGNPTGRVQSAATLQKLIELSDRYNFIIAADECYSEIYPDEANPPVGLLQVAAALGRSDYKNCVVFHSLSKRSNVPGLRSGFVAGDAQVMEQFLLYRTYHGSAMPLPTQYASVTAWRDEAHVVRNRAHYREKFTAVAAILKPVTEVTLPDAAFYLWLKTPEEDTTFARELFAHHNVTVLPGSYLSRAVAGINPGAGYVRLALVASLAESIDAAQRLRDFFSQRYSPINPTI